MLDWCIRNRFGWTIIVLMVSICMIECSKDVDLSEPMLEEEEEQEQESNDRFDIADFIAVEGDTLFLNSLSGYSTNCRLSAQGDTDFFRIDILGVDTIALGSQTIAGSFRMGFQNGIPFNKVWEVQHLPKGNPDTWDAKYATVLMRIVSEECENLSLIASEGTVETKRENNKLFIYVDEVLMIDHEKENEEGCGIRVSGKVTCGL